MATLETQPLHEIIASEAYWDGPIQNPVEDMEWMDGLEYKFQQAAVTNAAVKAEEIGRLVLSCNGGGTSTIFRQTKIYFPPIRSRANLSES